MGASVFAALLGLAQSVAADVGELGDDDIASANACLGPKLGF
ncbi:MAG: hypothetical protein ABWZ65_09800 [Pseudomonas mandelii]